MIDTARSKFLAELLGGGKAKVSDGDSVTAIKAEDVLWLQVPVVDAQRMAILNCIEELQKHMLDEGIVAQVPALVQNLGEQVVVWGVVHYNIGVIPVFDDAMEGDDRRMGRGELVQRNFANMELSTSASGADQAFHGKRSLRAREFLNGAVDNAIATDPKDFEELEGVAVNQCS